MNGDQIVSVLSPSYWNLVDAGPGSGKSLVIVERALHLRESGVLQSDMAFVTFTQIGAQVLKKRLKAKEIEAGFVGTLHAMILGALRQLGGRFLTLVDTEDSWEFVQRQAKLLGYRGSDEALRVALRSVDVSQSLPEYRVAREHRRWMRSEGMIDYDGVLHAGLELALTGKMYWPCLFVDEAQDSSQIDSQIYLAMNPQHLFIVGDACQSIFEFRGARPQNMEDFSASRQFAVHRLSQNYRCATRICEAANLVIGIPSKTVSATGLVGEVHTSAEESDESERVTVRQHVERLISSGTAPHEVAVLCRTNAMAGAMREALSSYRIPVSESLSDKKPKGWRLLRLILTQISQPNDWANGRILTREIAKVAGDDVVVAEAALEEQRRAGLVLESKWQFPTWQVIRSLNFTFARYGVSRACHELLIRYIRLYQPESIDELIEAMRESPEAVFVRGVHVSTVHSAKGTEFDAVVVPGADLFKGENMGEEHRLFFVAVTRARKSLLVTAAKWRSVVIGSGRTMRVENEKTGPMFEAVQSVARQQEVFSQ